MKKRKLTKQQNIKKRKMKYVEIVKKRKITEELCLFNLNVNDSFCLLFRENNTLKLKAGQNNTRTVANTVLVVEK